MKNLIVANWKMNPVSQKEGKEIFEAIRDGVKAAASAKGSGVAKKMPFLVLTGCVVIKDKKILEDQVDLIIDIKDISKLPNLLKSKLGKSQNNKIQNTLLRQGFGRALQKA
jgi:tRNA A37 methylthiotransferase MiaB